jgi:hypothetical protein
MLHEIVAGLFDHNTGYTKGRAGVGSIVSFALFFK